MAEATGEGWIASTSLAAPGEATRLQVMAEVPREWLAPKSAIPLAT